MVLSETAELRYRHVWEMFGKELTTNYCCNLSEIAAKNRTDLTGMRNWMLEHGLSVSRLKKEILHRYYGDSIPNAKNAETLTIKIKFRRHICHVNHLPINILYVMEAEMGHKKRMIELSHSDL